MNRYLPYFILVCMASVFCTSCKGQQERLEGVEYVKSLIDELVQAHSLSPDVLYLVSFSSEPETAGSFAPVVVPLSAEIEPYFIGDVEPYEVGEFRFAIWDIHRQEYIPWKEGDPSDQFFLRARQRADVASAVVIATVNGERWPRNHFGYAYSEKEIGFQVASEYATTFFLSKALEGMVVEKTAIDVSDGKGEFFFSHNASEDPELSFEYEQLFAYIKFDEVTVTLVFNGPSEARPLEEAEATKQKLLEALQGAVFL